MTIWKWPLRIVDRQTITAPGGTRFLHVEYQGYDLCLWGEVDPRNPNKVVQIYIVSTGQLFNENAAYIGTALTPDDRLVWHVYRGGEA